MAEAQTGRAPSARTSLRRKRDRGSYDPAVVAAILDAGLICHVGVVDGEGPVVVPMVYARVGDEVVVHGAAANRTLALLAGGAEACVTVTVLDGLVLARSAFHHSVNYRSVMLLGRGRAVTDPEEKRRLVDAVVDHVAPGRSGDARPASDAELRATAVVAFPVSEASAKRRGGGPVDEPEDMGLAVWAGVVPLALRSGPPEADVGVTGPPPPYASAHPRFPPA